MLLDCGVAVFVTCINDNKIISFLWFTDFAGLFLKHVYELLKKQEEFSPSHWVTADAAKASNMKQSETMR